VAACRVPVVAGVGHEIDVSLADLVADLRALTPTDAAVKVSPDGKQLAATVANLGERLPAALARCVTTARERLAQLARSRIFAEPERMVDERRTRVDAEGVRLVRLATAAIARGRERLAAAAGRLEAGSPLHLLARGWSLTCRDDESGVTLRSIEGVEAGMGIVTQLADGRIWSTVVRTDHAVGSSSTP